MAKTSGWILSLLSYYLPVMWSHHITKAQGTLISLWGNGKGKGTSNFWTPFHMLLNSIYVKSRFMMPISQMRKLRLREAEKLIDIHVRIWTQVCQSLELTHNTGNEAMWWKVEHWTLSPLSWSCHLWVLWSWQTHFTSPALGFPLL